jgi:hypothetical protein
VGRRLRAAGLVLLPIVASPGAAQPPPAEPVAARARLPATAGERFDETHDSLYRWVQRTLESFDRRFARTDHEPLEFPPAPFRIGFVVEAIERDGSVKLDLDTAFEARIRLPNIERRVRIVLTNEPISETAVEDEPDSLRAGVRVDVLRDFDFDVGVKLATPPVAFAALRWSRAAEAGSWDLYPLVKLFAESEDGLGASAGLTLDRWAGRTLLRSASSAKWRAELDQTEWSQLLTVARVTAVIEPDRYSGRVRGQDFARAVGLRAEAGGVRTAGADYYEAGFYLKWPVWSDWLYVSVSPFVAWDRERDWQADPGIRVGFDALFRKVARSPSASPPLD